LGDRKVLQVRKVRRFEGLGKSEILGAWGGRKFSDVRELGKFGRIWRSEKFLEFRKVGKFRRLGRWTKFLEVREVGKFGRLGRSENLFGRQDPLKHGCKILTESNPLYILLR
jgi:hypothetical protein